MTLIPPLRPTEQMPAVASLADLTYLWRALMGPLGFCRRSLWLMLLDADGQSGGLTWIEDVPAAAGPESARSVVDAVAAELGDGSLGVLFSRPGRAPMTDDDRSWARSLTPAARDRTVSLWPVHLATDAELVVFSPDDTA